MHACTAEGIASGVPVDEFEPQSRPSGSLRLGSFHRAFWLVLVRPHESSVVYHQGIQCGVFIRGQDADLMCADQFIYQVICDRTDDLQF